MDPKLSYCIVNTNGREHIPACLVSIAETHPTGVSHEILLLDNASDDGSAELAAELGAEDPTHRRGAQGDPPRPPRGKGGQRHPAAEGGAG